jgi:hypothetical protein
MKKLLKATIAYMDVIIMPYLNGIVKPFGGGFLKSGGYMAIY